MWARRESNPDLPGLFRFSVCASLGKRRCSYLEMREDISGRESSKSASKEEGNTSRDVRRWWVDASYCRDVMWGWGRKGWPKVRPKCRWRSWSSSADRAFVGL